MTPTALAPVALASALAPPQNIVFAGNTVLAENVDWSQVHAVRLLGVALAALILFWAIRRMFGGKK